MSRASTSVVSRGSSVSRTASGTSSDQPDATSASSGRAVHTMSNGTSDVNVATCSSRSSSAGSAQWMSSITTTSGPPVSAVVSRRRRTAHAISVVSAVRPRQADGPRDYLGDMFGVGLVVTAARGPRSPDEGEDAGPRLVEVVGLGKPARSWISSAIGQ